MDENLKRQLESLKPSIDDAPTRVLKRKNKNKIGISTLLAVCLVGGTLYMGERNGWVDYLKQQVTPPTASLKEASAPAQVAAPAPAPAPAPSKSSTHQPSDEAIFWQNVEKERRAEQTRGERQTVFNDSNYQARTNINTLQAPRQTLPTAQRQQRQPQGLNGSNRTRIEWEDTRGKRYWWRGTYRWQNSRIEYDDFCVADVYPRGSIEYRACRRSARDYLQAKCRNENRQQYRNMYCHAEVAFVH